MFDRRSFTPYHNIIIRNVLEIMFISKGFENTGRILIDTASLIQLSRQCLRRARRGFGCLVVASRSCIAGVPLQKSNDFFSAAAIGIALGVGKLSLRVRVTCSTLV